MHDCFSGSPGSLLVVIFGLGVAVGLLLAAWIMYLSWMFGRHTERRNWAAEVQAALKAREEQDLLIDEDRMVCAICWQERHPGQAWRLIWQTSRCKKHQTAELACALEKECAVS